MDRSLVGPLARTIDRLGFLTLDDAADYAAAIQPTSRSVDPLANVLFENAVPGVFQLMFRSDWKDLALWGGFSRDQRQTLLRGGTLPWMVVPQAQRNRLVQAVLRAETNEFQQTGPDPFGLGSEPTEALAGGAAMSDAITGMGHVNEAVFVKSTDDNPYNGGLASAGNLASAVIAREQKPDETHYDGLPKVLPSEFVPGRELDLGFSIFLSPTLIWRKYGQYGEVDLRARPQPLAALPARFQKEYKATLEANRKSSG